MPMRPCEKCQHNKWNFKSFSSIDDKKETKKTWTEAICAKCSHSILFGHKETPIGERPCAEYRIVDGKRFLKIDGLFYEVELRKLPKGTMKVCRVYPYNVLLD